MARLVTISGCSGGGKSSLLAELARRGFRVVEEPGRRVVAAGRDLPWVDMAGFARLALRLAVADYRALSGRGPVFLDRGIVDAALALAHAGGGYGGFAVARRLRGHRTVFLTPPWRAIYRQDAARRHGFDDAVAEYGRLRRGYAMLGYRVEDLPRISISGRADWLLSRLAARHS